MSGEVSRSRQKKAGSAAKKGGQSNSNAQAASQKYANKKKSKDRNNQKMNPTKKSSGICSCWTLVMLLTVSGVAMATYHQYPEKVREVYEKLPPQVNFNFDDI